MPPYSIDLKKKIAAGAHKGYIIALLLNILAVMAGGEALPKINSGFGALIGLVSENFFRQFAEQPERYVI